MIDSSVDSGFAALEREPSRHASPASRSGVAPARPRTTGSLADLPAEPAFLSARGALVVEQSAASAAVPPPPRETATPLDHLRLARFGFVAALFLLAAFLWYRQRRTR